MSKQGGQSAGGRHWGQLPVFSQDAVIGIGIVFFCAVTTIFLKGQTKKKEVFLSSAVYLGMFPTITSLMPHNYLSRKKKGKNKGGNKSTEALCQSNKFLEQNKICILTPERSVQRYAGLQTQQRPNPRLTKVSSFCRSRVLPPRHLIGISSTGVYVHKEEKKCIQRFLSQK